MPGLRHLERYPWRGHATLLGRHSHPGHATAEGLGRFGRAPRRGRARYRAFLAAGVAQGRGSELEGGGHVRSAGGWAAVQALRRGRERFAADERVLARAGRAGNASGARSKPSRPPRAAACPWRP